MAEADPHPPIDQATAAQTRFEEISERRARPKRWKQALLMFGVPLIAAAGALAYWISFAGKIQTDNAYIKLQSVSVAAEVGGPVSEAYVDDGDLVKKGDILFRIDPEKFKIALTGAQASLATAQADVTALSNDADLSGADISAAREDIAYARSRLERQEALWNRGFTTKADYDAARHQLMQAEEALRAADARRREAQAKLASGNAVPGVNPRVATARASEAAASLQLRRTEVRAPISGQVAQANRLEVGETVIVGMPMLEIVSQDGAYIEANFKETELDGMRVGQPATIRVDAYPGLKLKGHVQSIGAGTGSEASLLPAQNASGNWVKVTQRVPVRIAIDETSPRKLIAGLSAHVTVNLD